MYHVPDDELRRWHSICFFYYETKFADSYYKKGLKKQFLKSYRSMQREFNFSLLRDLPNAKGQWVQSIQATQQFAYLSLPIKL